MFDFSAISGLLDGAGELALRWFRADPALLGTDDKGGAHGYDPVTAADRAVETYLRRALEERFPGHQILGEEQGLTGPDGRYRWVIDPIDGTKAFVTGVPAWGVLLGLLDNGVPIAGWMRQPYLQETFAAHNGQALFHGPPDHSTGAPNVPGRTASQNIADQREEATSHDVAGPRGGATSRTTIAPDEEATSPNAAMPEEGAASQDVASQRGSATSRTTAGPGGGAALPSVSVSEEGAAARRGVALRTRKVADPADAVLYCTHPNMFLTVDEQAAFARLAGAVRLQRFGGDCYSYCLLAMGLIDLVVDADMQPYDIVPLIPIVQGAGGVVTDRNGNPAADGGFIVAAATPELHARALDILA